MARINKVDIDQEVNFTGPFMKRVTRTIFIKLNEIIDAINELYEARDNEFEEDEDDDTPVSIKDVNKGLKNLNKKQ